MALLTPFSRKFIGTGMCPPWTRQMWIAISMVRRWGKTTRCFSHCAADRQKSRGRPRLSEARSTCTRDRFHLDSELSQPTTLPWANERHEARDSIWAGGRTRSHI